MSSGGSKIKWFAIAGAAVIILGGGFTLAYAMQWWPFAGALSDADITAHLADRLGQMHSAVYAFSVSIQSEARDASAQPINVTFPEFDQQKQLYDRDEQRMQTLFHIRSGLLAYFEKQKTYPVTLVALKSTPKTGGMNYYFYNNLSISDPSTGQPYAYHTTNGGTDYALSATFETQQAADMMNKAQISMQDKTATFTKKDPSYLGYVALQEPAFVTFFRNQDMYVSFLPTDLTVGLNASGTTQVLNDASSSVNASFEAGGNLQAGDFSVSADVAFLKMAQTYYVDIVKFPSLFIDLSPIKNKWVSFSSGISAIRDS